MRVEIDLLGGFAVRVDGQPVPPGEWRRRHAVALVKLLALAPRRTVHREQVVDALWPDTGSTTLHPGCTRLRTTPGAHSATTGHSSSPGTPCRCSRTPM